MSEASRFVGLLVLVSAPMAGVGCGNGAPSAYPPRAEGCAVEIFAEAPRMPTDNLGTVTARCDDSVSDDDCKRTLKDEACKLGADIVWGVSDDGAKVAGKKKFVGRAAHTKGH